MSVARTDCRFLLPQPVRRAAVANELGAWHAGLGQVDVDLAPNPREREADLWVTTAKRLDGLAAGRPETVVVEGGDARRRLRRLDYAARRYLAYPSVEEATLLVPLDQPGATRFALERLLDPHSGPKRLRNRAASLLLARGMPAPGRSLVTVGARRHGRPWLIEAAGALGVPPEVEWLLVPGQGDPLSRGVFRLFDPGSARPRWALKFARVRGYEERSVRDRRGLSVAADGGEVLRAHAPRLIGAFVADGHHASIETAATGQRLSGWLHSSVRSRRKLAKVEEIAAWIVDIAVRTASPPAELEPEIERLERVVLPAWGARPGLAEGLPPMPAVAQHNDLGTWNVVVDERGFTALDWEYARRHGMPLWDLWYFLADATAHLDGAVSFDQQERHFVSLFEGHLQWSSLLFRWTRKGVEASAIPPRSVGAVATLFWLHHALSHEGRRTELQDHAPAADLPARALQTPYQRLARHWLSEPQLGPGWDRWQR